MGKLLGGVEKSQRREYGRSSLKVLTKSFFSRFAFQTYGLEFMGIV